MSIHSENIDLINYNQSIIVKIGLLYAKEIITNIKIIIYNNKKQGSMHDNYVLSLDFKTENIVKYEKLNKQLNKKLIQIN